MDDLKNLPEPSRSRAKALLTCSLCSQYFVDPRVLPCRHSFCRKCLQKSYDHVVHSTPPTKRRVGSMACPTCAQPIGVPTAGIRGFPVDTKISRIKDLVVNEMAQNISKKISGEDDKTASCEHCDSCSTKSDGCARPRRNRSTDDVAATGRNADAGEDKVSGYKRNPAYPDLAKFARYFDENGKPADPMQFKPTLRGDRHRLGYSNSFHTRQRKRTTVRMRAYDDSTEIADLAERRDKCSCCNPSVTSSQSSDDVTRPKRSRSERPDKDRPARRCHRTPADSFDEEEDGDSDVSSHTSSAGQTDGSGDTQKSALPHLRRCEGTSDFVEAGDDVTSVPLSPRDANKKSSVKAKPSSPNHECSKDGEKEHKESVRVGRERILKETKSANSLPVHRENIVTANVQSEQRQSNSMDCNSKTSGEIPRRKATVNKNKTSNEQSDHITSRPSRTAGENVHVDNWSKHSTSNAPDSREGQSRASGLGRKFGSFSHGEPPSAEEKVKQESGYSRSSDIPRPSRHDTATAASGRKESDRADEPAHLQTKKEFAVGEEEPQRSTKFNARSKVDSLFEPGVPSSRSSYTTVRRPEPNTGQGNESATDEGVQYESQSDSRTERREEASKSGGVDSTKRSQSSNSGSGSPPDINFSKASPLHRNFEEKVEDCKSSYRTTRRDDSYVPPPEDNSNEFVEESPPEAPPRASKRSASDAPSCEQQQQEDKSPRNTQHATPSRREDTSDYVPPPEYVYRSYRTKEQIRMDCRRSFSRRIHEAMKVYFSSLDDGGDVDELDSDAVENISQGLFDVGAGSPGNRLRNAELNNAVSDKCNAGEPGGKRIRGGFRVKGGANSENIGTRKLRGVVQEMKAVAENEPEPEIPEKPGRNWEELIRNARAKYSTERVAPVAPCPKDAPVCADGIYSMWSLTRKEFCVPTSLGITSKGCVIVAEYGQSCVEFYDEDGAQAHKLDGVKPFGLVINNKDQVIIGDRKGRSVRIFDEYGCDVAHWDAATFNWISGLGILPNCQLAIYDRERCKLGVYSSPGEKIRDFASFGSTSDSQLCMADFIAVDSKSRILVADSGNHCIKAFDANSGVFVGKFGGTRGESGGCLDWPKGICVDSRDNIIVTDVYNDRVSMFSADGQFVRHLITNIPNLYSVCYAARPTPVIGLTRYSLDGMSQYDVYAVGH